MKLAIFGGTFDPVHQGHLELANLALRRLSLNAVLFVPAKCSPFKVGRRVTEARHRCEMLRLAMAGRAGLRLDECELEREGDRSYTLDTVLHLERKYPGCRRFSLIIGFDQAILFTKWHRWAELLQRADVVVVRRCGAVGSLPEVLAQATELEFDSPCSSTMLRERLASGRDGGGCLLSSVRRYIDEKGLYRNR